VGGALTIDTTLLIVGELNEQYVSALEADQQDMARALLDEAIGLLAGTLPGTSKDHPLFPLASATAASAYELRWAADGPPADLDAAISHARAALRELLTRPARPDGEPVDQLELRRLLGSLLGSRFTEAEPDPADRQAVAAARQDRDEAIACLAAAHQPALAARGDPDELEVCRMLAELYQLRYSDPWPEPLVHSEDLTAAVSALTMVASQPQPEREDVAALLAVAWERYCQSDAAGDRDNFIQWGQLLLQMPDPEGAPPEAVLLDALALAMLDRAEVSGDEQAALTDVEAAIACLETGLAVLPSDDPDRSGLLAFLAGAYADRLARNGLNHSDFDRKMDYARKALELPPSDPEIRAFRYQAGLYIALEIFSHFDGPGQSFDPGLADLAIRVLLECEQGEELDPELHPSVVTLLAVYHATLAQVTGSATALSETRRWARQAASEVSLGNSENEGLVSMLARAFGVLVTHGATVGDLDQAIEVLSAAAGWSSGNPSEDAVARGALGLTLVFRAQLAGQPADLDSGISKLLETWEMLPDRDSQRGLVASHLSSALMIRYQQRGDAQDMDAAEYYLNTVRELVSSDAIELAELVPHTNVVLGGTRGMFRILRGIERHDLLAIDEGISAIRAVLAGLSPGQAYYAQLQSDLGLGLACRAALKEAPAREAEEAVQLLSAVLAAQAPDDVRRPLTRMRLCGALAFAGLRLEDPHYLRQAIACAAAARDELDSGSASQVRFGFFAGLQHRQLYQLTQSRWDLSEAIRWLTKTRRELIQRPGLPYLGDCLIELARCYHSEPESGLALEAGEAALRERGRDVLLQTGTARSLGLARKAAEEAVEVAGWCLADGDAEAAAEVLELGRGLILHSATVVTSVTDMLIQLGQHQLAAEWQAAPAAQQPAPWDSPGLPGNPMDLLVGSGPPEIPADLRGRVLNALTQAGTNPLLIPPACADIAEALTRTGADALAYLLEPTDKGPGHAIIVAASSGQGRQAVAEILSLPLLEERRSGPLARYSQADEEPGLDSAAGPADCETTREQWSQALDQLCDWAGPAVMAPLLEHVGGWALGRPARLVLVPAGRLSLVPWHAARLGPVGAAAASTASARYACAEAVISYAASGRQLVEVSKRQALALQSDPVLVGNPDHAVDMVFGALEAHCIRVGCYPDGRYLGHVLPLAGSRSDGTGQPAEILSELPSATRPGASVLHLGCHARLAADAPGESYLELADGQRLAIETILRQAGSRPAAAPGGLVCLAACSSAHGGAAHDEALSLSTAFLAAGATTVIGTRWNVASGATSVLMFMFHWFLAVDGQEPRDALRSAQTWLLDPNRTVPAQVPGDLAKFLRGPGDLPVADWAAFAHQGR
jgi:hypothetical protein